MNNKKSLLLITSGFPFGDTERGFISTEFEELAKNFNIYLLSVGSREEIVHPFPDNIPVEKYFHRVSFRSVFSLLSLIKNALRPITVSELFRSFSMSDIRCSIKRAKQILFYVTKADLASKHIETLIKRENIDCIYTYWCTEMTLGAAMLKDKHENLKILTRFHGHDLYTERRPENWQPFRRYISKKADKLVFACKTGLDYYISHWQDAKNKSELHYLGCKEFPRIYKENNDQLHIVSCSNLIKLKRVDLIIDALSLMKSEYSIRWDHFGDGDERSNLEAQASAKLGKNIEYRFHGRVPNNTIAEHYRRISPELFITASSTEGGAPVSIQEAFAMGIPAIGTNAGGIPDLIKNDHTGFLLNESPTAQDICDAVEKYIDLSDNDKKKLSDNAYRLWEDKFNSRSNAVNFVNMLIQLERYN